MNKKGKLWRSIIICIFLLASIPACVSASDGFVTEASGTLRIGWASESATTVLLNEPSLVKVAFDQGWSQLRDKLDKLIHNGISQIESDSLQIATHIATHNQTELREKAIPDGVALKYILHDNRMEIKWMPSGSSNPYSYLITFDIEVELAMRSSSQEQHIELSAPGIYLRNHKITGHNGWKDLFIIPIVEFTVKNALSATESLTDQLQPITDDIVEQMMTHIRSVLPKVPHDRAYLQIGVEPESDIISLCFKSVMVAVCEFE